MTEAGGWLAPVDDRQHYGILQSASLVPNADPFEEAVAARDRGEYSRALHLFEAIAKNGQPYGLVPLASMYMEGQGTEVDLSRAEDLLNQAAQLGVREAVLQKATLWYARGDMTRHFLALQEAARLGILPACYRLALCFARGTGVAKDDAKALTIMSEAAARGHVGAKMHLARRLLVRPINPAGFTRGVAMMITAIGESLRIGTRNPDDDRFR